jgi:hypothetical protein
MESFRMDERRCPSSPRTGVGMRIAKGVKGEEGDAEEEEEEETLATRRW